MGVLRKAIRKRQYADIVYRNGDGKESARRVRPLVIWNLTDGWMFLAWCEMRGDFRTFRFDRMAALTIPSETFSDDEATGLRAFMALERCEAPDA